MDRGKSYPFNWTNNPLEVKVFNYTSLLVGSPFIYVELLGRKNEVLPLGSLLMDVFKFGKIPHSWIVMNCMSSSQFVAPELEGLVEVFSENIIILSKVKKGLTVEFNGVEIADFDIDEDATIQDSCEKFHQGDVQNVRFNGLDLLSKSFRQSGKYEKMAFRKSGTNEEFQFSRFLKYSSHYFK